ncbi:hypothetical protein BSKO_06253 [Bryopsis sp. KO-2023]|nr:hypothetical protein BSKO_06253 [Bryopsis sp. KO-2023]
MIRSLCLPVLVLLAVFAGYPCWADTTEFSLKRKEYSCLGQPYPEAAPSDWVKAEELVTIRNQEDHDPCDTGGYPFKLADLAPLRNLGKIVVAPLSNCSTWTAWEDYRRDFVRRLMILNYTSPAGIVFGEAHPGKLPEWFWTMGEITEMKASHLLPPPVCTMDKWQFGKLTKDIDTFGGDGAVFSKAALYHSDSAPTISPAITSIEIETQVGEEIQTITVPAATSAFNPVETEMVYDHIVESTFEDACYGDPGERDFSQCVDCWSTYYFWSDGPVKNTWEMRDAVVFFDTSSGPVMCYEWLYNFVMIAQANGAKGVIVGGSSTDDLWMSSPYLVSEKVRIPMFAVSSTTASIVKHALDSPGSIQARLPALSGRTGPAFYGEELFLEGWTDIAFWDLSADRDEEDYDNHFECAASYASINGDVDRSVARFNPGGLVLSAESGELPTGTLLKDFQDLPFPIFFITHNCYTRVTKDLDELYVSLAGRKNDTNLYSGFTLHMDHEKLEETVLKVHEPEELRGAYLAGQSGFNPNQSFAHSAEVAVLRVKDECKGVGDNSSSNQRGHPTTFNGNEYNISDQGLCMRPYTGVIRQAQESGALAVIFVNWDSGVYTFQVPGHGEINIPSFNVPLEFGMDVLWEALYGESVVMEIPRVTRGVALTLDEFAEEMETSPDITISGPLELLMEERREFLRASRKPPSNRKNRVTQRALMAILLASIAVVVLAAFGTLLWVRLQKRRRMRYLLFSDDGTVNPLGEHRSKFYRADS